MVKRPGKKGKTRERERPRWFGEQQCRRGRSVVKIPKKSEPEEEGRKCDGDEKEEKVVRRRRRRKGWWRRKERERGGGLYTEGGEEASEWSRGLDSYLHSIPTGHVGPCIDGRPPPPHFLFHLLLFLLLLVFLLLLLVLWSSSLALTLCFKEKKGNSLIGFPSFISSFSSSFYFDRLFNIDRIRGSSNTPAMKTSSHPSFRVCAFREIPEIRKKLSSYTAQTSARFSNNFHFNGEQFRYKANNMISLFFFF